MSIITHISFTGELENTGVGTTPKTTTYSADPKRGENARGFVNWMRKIKNIHLTDLEAMDRAMFNLMTEK